jgi:hypothetical protein
MRLRLTRRGVGLIGAALLVGALFPIASVSAVNPTVTPASGGTGILTTTAANTGSGAWTTLTGPVITESTIGEFPVGGRFQLSLPTNFQFNVNQTAAPSVTGCDKASSAIVYTGSSTATITIALTTGPAQFALCVVNFGTTLQIRPIDGNLSAGAGGPIGLTYFAPDLPTPGVVPGGAGQVSMVAPPPPPTGTLALAITSPTMNNSAIIWGESFIDITTRGTPGTVFQIQATSDNRTWVPIANSSGTPLSFTIASSGASTFRYTPIRNFWYRSVAGSTLSNVVRITVRQTCQIRPTSTATVTVAKGSTITFTTTSRPARSDLPTANVVFQTWQRTSSGSWVLQTQVTRPIDANGIVTWPVTFSNTGSFYVRAQTQPTSVNANSFWTPNQYYNVN